MATYVPGAWFAVVGRHAVVLFPPEESARVAATWELVQTDPSLSALLDTFLREGLASLPSFALASWDDQGLGVVLRGPVTAEAAGGSFDGSGISTWVERRFEGTTTLTLSAPVGRVASAGSYAVLGGVVLVDALVIDTADTADTPDAPPAVDPHATVIPSDEQDDDHDDDAPAPEPVPEPAPEPVPEPAPDPALSDPYDGTYDDLFGATVARRPEDAAIRTLDEDGDAILEPPVQPEPQTEPEIAPGEATDHDGRTVFGARPVLPPPVAPAAAPPAAPAVPTLRFSSGEVVELDRTVIAGRAPEARRFQSGEQPRLVAVPSPQLEISGTHLEMHAENDDVVATDLGSTNGTLLTRPGEAPVQLTAGQPTPAPPGSVVNLGDGVTITVVAPGAGS